MILLQKVNLKEVLYNLDARRLLLRIYYQLKEINPLLSLIESTKIYIHRQKDMGYGRENYLNFLKFLEKIMYKSTLTITEKQELQNEIEATQLLAEREWLLSEVSS
jgi:hypothetical protein